jgi:hypothetical protein
VYAHLLTGYDGGRSRAWAKLLGFGAPASKPTISAAGVAWPGGASAAFSPPASAFTAANATFPAAPVAVNSTEHAANVTLSLPAGTTFFGLKAALPFPTRGALRMTVTVAAPGGGAGTTLLYPLSPAGDPVGPKVYAAVAVFGDGYTIASVQVAASNLAAAGKLVLGPDFDVASGKVAFPKLF